jgi:hypothetical protein
MDGHYRAGFRFGKLGLDLVEQRGPLARRQDLPVRVTES